MGPLAGHRILEVAGLGPGPFAAMLLADMGAEVVRVDRIPRAAEGEFERVRAGVDPSLVYLNRGRRSLALDLKSEAGKEAMLKLVEGADALIEGFRPGVMERLGLGPDECAARNPRLVYGRMTGWGQDGPLSRTAGHDVNYVALTGALRSFARAGEAPVPPLSLVGDMGGGGLTLAFGILCGLIEAKGSGEGQVIDAAIVDGVATMLTMFHGFIAQGRWQGEPGTNFADTGAPYYDVYETADGGYMAVGALETPFYATLVEGLGLNIEDLPSRDDPTDWPALREVLAAAFRRQSRDHWTAVFADTDACCTPVLSLTEAPENPHLVARETFVEVDGNLQPAPAPRFSRTPGRIGNPPPAPGDDTAAVLESWGFTADEIATLRRSNTISGG